MQNIYKLSQAEVSYTFHVFHQNKVDRNTSSILSLAFFYLCSSELHENIKVVYLPVYISIPLIVVRFLMVASLNYKCLEIEYLRKTLTIWQDNWVERVFGERTTSRGSIIVYSLWIIRERKGMTRRNVKFWLLRTGSCHWILFLMDRQQVII